MSRYTLPLWLARHSKTKNLIGVLLILFILSVAVGGYLIIYAVVKEVLNG